MTVYKIDFAGFKYFLNQEFFSESLCVMMLLYEAP